MQVEKRLYTTLESTHVILQQPPKKLFHNSMVGAMFFSGRYWRRISAENWRRDAAGISALLF
jgi:hypothetical protein